MFRGFIGGIAAVLAAGALAIFLVVRNGWIDPRADDGYLPMERWAARAVPAAIRRDSAGLTSPIQATDANLVEGAKLYGRYCAICHGAADAHESTIARGLYIKPPQLAKHGVEDDPAGRTFYTIAHGMRLTPMPAFGKMLSDDQLWQLALFLKNMDKLPPAAEAEFKRIARQ